MIKIVDGRTFRACSECDNKQRNIAFVNDKEAAKSADHERSIGCVAQSATRAACNIAYRIKVTCQYISKYVLVGRSSQAC